MVKAELGLVEHEQIVGFLYLGSLVGDHPVPPRPDVDAFVQEWPRAVVE